MLHAWVVGGAAPAQSVGETTLPFLVSTHETVRVCVPPAHAAVHVEYVPVVQV